MEENGRLARGMLTRHVCHFTKDVRLCLPKKEMWICYLLGLGILSGGNSALTRETRPLLEQDRAWHGPIRARGRTGLDLALHPTRISWPALFHNALYNYIFQINYYVICNNFIWINWIIFTLFYRNYKKFNYIDKLFN